MPGLGQRVGQGGVPDGGIILTTDRLNRIRGVDPTNATMTVEAGCILANIQAAADEVDAELRAIRQ